MVEYIRDSIGAVIGYYQTSGDSFKYLFDKNGTLLGYYNKVSDRTYNSDGVIVAQGDNLSMLLR